jgi:hypothetical protein
MRFAGWFDVTIRKVNNWINLHLYYTFNRDCNYIRQVKCPEKKSVYKIRHLAHQVEACLAIKICKT